MLYDITRPIGEGVAVWPGDVPFRLAWTMRRAHGASVNLSELRLSAHTGTHTDAPFHAADEGVRMGAVPLDAYLGPALVIDVEGRDTIDRDWIADVLASASAERLLFRTGCWTDPTVFPERFPPISPTAASLMADSGVRLVGTDAPSVDPFDSKDLLTHHVFGRAGVAILETLLLDDVPPGPYELIALPLRLVDADASPVRAVLRAR